MGWMKERKHNAKSRILTCKSEGCSRKYGQNTKNWWKFQYPQTPVWGGKHPFSKRSSLASGSSKRTVQIRSEWGKTCSFGWKKDFSPCDFGHCGHRFFEITVVEFSLNLVWILHHFTRKLLLAIYRIEDVEITWNRFLSKTFERRFSCVALVETCCWNVDMCSQNHRKVMKAEHGGLTLRKLNSTSTSRAFNSRRHGEEGPCGSTVGPALSLA